MIGKTEKARETRQSTFACGAWMSDSDKPRSRNISEAKRRAVLLLLTAYHLRNKMGGFLDKPKTEKSEEIGEGNGLKYGVVSMQGWRVEMEDSHSAITGLPGDFKGSYHHQQ